LHHHGALIDCFNFGQWKITEAQRKIKKYWMNTLLG